VLTGAGVLAGVVGAIVAIPLVAAVNSAVKYLTGIEDIDGRAQGGYRPDATGAAAEGGAPAWLPGSGDHPAADRSPGGAETAPPDDSVARYDGVRVSVAHTADGACTKLVADGLSCSHGSVTPDLRATCRPARFGTLSLTLQPVGIGHPVLLPEWFLPCNPPRPTALDPCGSPARA